MHPSAQSGRPGATPPGLVVRDGYGVAHPRRFGLASHLGVLTGLPGIGVAKNPFTFTHLPPGGRRGGRTPLHDGTEEAGRALRLAPAHRLPETRRRADALCRAALKAAVRGGAGQG